MGCGVQAEKVTSPCSSRLFEALLREYGHDDPEVADFLSAHSADFEIEKLDMTLKGFYEERFALRRIRKSG